MLLSVLVKGVIGGMCHKGEDQIYTIFTVCCCQGKLLLLCKNVFIRQSEQDCCKLHLKTDFVNDRIRFVEMLERWP